MTARAILVQARDHHSAIVVGRYGRPPKAGPLPGDVSTAVAHRADVPALVIRAQGASRAAEEDGPILVCYDGSDEAQAAVNVAAELLPGREPVVAWSCFRPDAAFLEPVDDVAVLRQTVPWPPPAETKRRLARP